MNPLNEEKLIVVWSTADKEVASKMVFMYTLNAKKFSWWQEITLIVWGPSARLLAEDLELQLTIREMRKAGIKLEACLACAESYRVDKKLADLGIDVKYMGEPLTTYLKSGYKILSF